MGALINTLNANPKIQAYLGKQIKAVPR